MKKPLALYELPNQSGRPSVRVWKFRCACGREFETKKTYVDTSRTRSCGCLKIGTPTHGLSTNPIYTVWTNMHKRCGDSSHVSYSSHGGRGITVCDRWQDISLFYEDMGDRPNGHTLERTDNEQGYNPDNCVWATWQTQHRNKRSNRMITYLGETLCLADWAERTGINRNTLTYRLNEGWTPERILAK